MCRPTHEMNKAAGDAYQLQTLTRGASVLNLLLENENFTLREASEALKLNSTITFRLLRTWASSGYLHYDQATKRYGAGLMLMRLAAKTRVAAGVPQAEARLTELSRKIDQTCSCGVLVGRQSLYVARVLANRALTYNVEVGRTLPAFATSMGQVLLAYEPIERIIKLYPEPALPPFTEHTITDREVLVVRLAEIRELGYSVNHRQMSLGISAVAVPVRSSDGKVIAGMSIAGPADQFTESSIFERYLPSLLEATREPMDLD